MCFHICCTRLPPPVASTTQIQTLAPEEPKAGVKGIFGALSASKWDMGTQLSPAGGSQGDMEVTSQLLGGCAVFQLEHGPRGCCGRRERTFHPSFQLEQPGRETLPCLRCRAGLAPPQWFCASSCSSPRSRKPGGLLHPGTLLSPHGHPLELQRARPWLLPTHRATRGSAGAVSVPFPVLRDTRTPTERCSNGARELWAINLPGQTCSLLRSPKATPRSFQSGICPSFPAAAAL